MLPYSALGLNEISGDSVGVVSILGGEKMHSGVESRVITGK